LLLVDYIFAWARDIYREDIIRELRVLASGENDAASSKYSDTDIFSTRRQENYFSVSDGDEHDKFQQYMTLQKAYASLDSDSVAIRNATFIESKYCCIYVTRDNIQTLIQSFDQSKAQQLCHAIMDQMSSGSLLLNLSTLAGMETQWTGNIRISPSGYLQQMTFHCVVSGANYLSDDWHQVRELNVIAIAEDAWDTMIYAAYTSQNTRRTPKPRLDGVVDGGLIATILKRLRAGSTAETLLDSIARRAIRISLPDKYNMDNNFSDLQGCRALRDNGFLRHIVRHTYESFKRGSFEPKEPFIRASSRFEQHGMLHSDVEAYSAGEEPLKVSDDGWVMLCHTGYQSNLNSKTCLYQVEGDPMTGDKEKLLRNIVHTIETRDVYHTTLDDGPMDRVDYAWHIPWNLQNTYGLFTGSFDYLGFISKMNSDIRRSIVPKTQGSMRESTNSMSHLLSRNLTPSPRLGPASTDFRNLADRTFVRYKIMTNEISYWKERGLQRHCQDGIPCCRLCRGTLEQNNDICKICYRALDDSKVEQWLYDAFLSEPSLHGNANSRTSNFDQGFSRQQGSLPEYLFDYPKLDKHFRDMVELQAQRRDFWRWLSQEGFAFKYGERFRSDLGISSDDGKKRRRKDGK